MDNAKELLANIVNALVDNPEAVTIESDTDEMGVLLKLHVDPQDMGKIIGRSGNIAKSIRVLLRAAGMRANARINLKILEPEGSTYSREVKDVRADEQSDSEMFAQ